MTRVDEIAANIFRISTYVPDFNLQFNQFLVRDDQPLLFETGMKRMFPIVREAVATVVDPKSLQYVSFSHFEPDECGSLNEWLSLAPRAEAVCSIVGAMVFVNDAAVRPARGLPHDAMIETGKCRFRFKATPHLPHGWDAGFLFEETTRTLLCSDLLGHAGDTPPMTDSDVVGAFRETTRQLHAFYAAHRSSDPRAGRAKASRLRYHARFDIHRQRRTSAIGHGRRHERTAWLTAFRRNDH